MAKSETDVTRLYILVLSEPPTAWDCRQFLNAKFLEKWSWVCFISVLGNTDPANHSTTMAVGPLQMTCIRSLGCTAVEWLTPCRAPQERGAWWLGKPRASWTFPRTHNIWVQWHGHSSHWNTACHLGRRKWPPYQAWCRQHQLYTSCFDGSSIAVTLGADRVWAGHKSISVVTLYTPCGPTA